MFEVDTYVLYGSQGVCRIDDVRSEDFSGQAKEYYILVPADDPKMVIYVPTDAAALTGQMRPLLSPEELNTMIRQGCTDDTLEWIADPRARNEMFKSILSSGDRRLTFRMLRTIHERREAQLAEGRKLYAADELAFERAEKLLHGEIAAILQIGLNEVQNYIRSLLPAEG